MREISLSCPASMPRTERRWLALGDRLRMLWLNTGRKPLKGIVKIGYLWELPEPPKTIQEEAKLAVGLIEILGFLVDLEARLFIGEARCERAEKPMLRVTVEET